ncbi:MAG: hypothetical protein ACON4R_02040 [Akkermansiaceae bacterium]
MPDDHRVPQLAGISLIFTFKQARVVDAIGDVVGVQAEISELRSEARESDDKDTNKEEIEELMKEDLPAEQEDAQNAFASLHNGSVIWTVLSQIGGAIFGLGIISIFPMDNENERIRSTALLLMTNTGGLVGGAAL